MELVYYEPYILNLLGIYCYFIYPIAIKIFCGAPEEISDIFKCNFCQVYGLPETCGAGTILTPEDHDPALGKLRSCGKPAPTAEVRIVGEEGGILPANEVGEITYRSKSLMKGYWKNDEATAKSIQNG